MTHRNDATAHDDLPHDPDRSAAQIAGLLAHLGDAPKHVLDLGCGTGRILVPLVRAGHCVIGLDRDTAALLACRQHARSLNVQLIETDFSVDRWRESLAGVADQFDAIVLLGNTFMTIWDVDRAADLLTQAAALLRPHGEIVLDDIPHDLWPLLTEGQWCSGVSAESESGDDEGRSRQQLVWSADDNVFSLRSGADVDAGDWSFRPGETRFRLWTMGELQLLARLAGLSAPKHLAKAGLVVMRRNDSE